MFVFLLFLSRRRGGGREEKLLNIGLRLSRLRRVFFFLYGTILPCRGILYLLSFLRVHGRKGRRVNVLFMVILSSYGSLQIFYLNDSPTGFKIALEIILLRTY